MEIKREWLEDLIFESELSRRFTQDSPILPDVWICYGQELSRNEDACVDLLLTPHKDWTTGDLFLAIRSRLALERAENGRSTRLRRVAGRASALAAPPPDDQTARVHPDVAYNQSVVVARLFFDELLRVALPMTSWWRERVCKRPGRSTASDLYTPEGREAIAADIKRAVDGQTREAGPADLLWLIKLVGSILVAAETPDPNTEEARKKVWDDILNDEAQLAERFREFVLDPLGADGCDAADGTPPALYMVSRNRKAAPTDLLSVQAVKADAARRLFQASSADLAWVIMDSGIDATHPAFRRRDASGTLLPQPFAHDGRRMVNQTRVMATFDFTRVRFLLSGDPVAAKKEADRIDTAILRVKEEQKELRKKLRKAPEAEKAALQRKADRVAHLGASLASQRKRWRSLAENSNADVDAKMLRTALQSGRVVDWECLRPFLEVAHEDELYKPPVHEHGTHVAGILAADWRKDDWNRAPADGSAAAELTDEDVCGVCPDIRLYDFRVFDDAGNGDEFSVMAALQFLRHLNAHRELPLIHGANLSLSIRHDVANYACGRTPVCDECERVVASGVVVVAAAGNYGYNRFSTITAAGGPAMYEGYSDISITDPGNSEAVITVGSTHRIEPHTYGVSYFSSRGPTGDGRYKPDLVAPGEKIFAPVPGNGGRIKDGTSMAAPHVSGAAALILARYRELIGRPARVKQVLCATATDLGRDRYFQGAGMVDVLRALQSI